MKFICIIVLPLCLLTGSCDLWKDRLDIDIGDYENQLAAWNSQNMLDYRFSVRRGSNSDREFVIINVKNGIPESSDPPSWITEGEKSTIPEFYSLIKGYEKNYKDWHDSGDKRYLSLKVRYDTEYHYPSNIEAGERFWFIVLKPQGKLDIDIGDYENQLAAWNSQNMLDYRIELTGVHMGGWKEYELYNVANGISYGRSPIQSKTIPEFYSLIKYYEKYYKDMYDRGTKDSHSLNVSYDIEYHYPSEIIMTTDSHLVMGWKIVLLPPEETEQETENSEE